MFNKEVRAIHVTSRLLLRDVDAYKSLKSFRNFLRDFHIMKTYYKAL